MNVGVTLFLWQVSRHDSRRLLELWPLSAWWLTYRTRAVTQHRRAFSHTPLAREP